MPCENPVAASTEAGKALTAEQFAAAMAHCLARGAPWPGAVAVSGGGDSKALMVLLAEWSAAAGQPPPVILTVDHGLGPDSARVARGVLKDARCLGLKACKLVWEGPKPDADIEAAARSARYGLMGAWCVAHRVNALYVAHTLEDQAETFLLRLVRGSGLDGLAAMRLRAPFPLAGFDRLCLVRPLLATGRESLRAMLLHRGESWVEDPMNSDPRFARVRVRLAWPALEGLGLTAGRVAAAAHHLERARAALEDSTAEFLDAACRIKDDRIVLDGARLAEAAPEIALRGLAHILLRVSGEAYRPRFERLERLYLAIRDDTLKAARTLHGCRIGRAPKSDAVFGPRSLLVTRESARRPNRRGFAARGEIS